MLCGSIRVKDGEDALAPSDALQLDVDPNEVGHPSLTISFTFKVSSMFQFCLHQTFKSSHAAHACAHNKVLEHGFLGVFLLELGDIRHTQEAV